MGEFSLLCKTKFKTDWWLFHNNLNHWLALAHLGNHKWRSSGCISTWLCEYIFMRISVNLTLLERGEWLCEIQTLMLCGQISASQHHRLIVFKSESPPLFGRLQDDWNQEGLCLCPTNLKKKIKWVFMVCIILHLVYVPEYSKLTCPFLKCTYPMLKEMQPQIQKSLSIK